MESTVDRTPLVSSSRH